MKPTDREINEAIAWAAKEMDHGTRYPGMSYEEGVRIALEWVLDRTCDPPHDQDDEEE